MRASQSAMKRQRTSRAPTGMPKRDCKPPSRRMRKSQEAAKEQLRAEPSKIRVLAYGDSLTSGYVPCEQCCVQERDPCSRCRRTPWLASFRQVLQVDGDHKGREGWTTALHVDELDKEGGLSSLLAEAQSAGKPYSAVIIMSGSNDLADGDSSATIVQNLAIIHQAAHSFGARTVALAIPASRGWAEESDLGLRGNAVNEEMGRPGWCDGVAQGECLFVNSPLCYSAEPMWYSDGLHLTAEGYAEFGKRLAANAELKAFLGMLSKSSEISE